MHTIGDSVLEHAVQYREGNEGSTSDGRAFLELPQTSEYNTAGNLYLAALSVIVKIQAERDAAQAALVGLREAASFLIARVGMDAVVDGELSDYCYFCNGDAIWSRETKSYKVYHEAGCVLMGLRDALASHGVPAHTGETKEQA